MYYQLRRGSRPEAYPIRISFKRHSTTWRLICAAILKTIHTIISIPVIAVLSFVVIITLFFKWIVSLAHRYACLGGNLTSMSSNEIRWLGESWARSTVLSVFILDSEIELRYLKELVIKKALPQCTRLTERPVVLTNVFGNSYCWMSERNSFDINEHVYKSCDYPMDKKQIQGYIGKLVSRGLSIDKPPWELHLLSRNDLSMPGKRDSVVVFVAHRCLADWMSLAKLLCTCLSDTKTYYHVSENPPEVLYWANMVETIFTGSLELLWKIINPVNKNNHATPPDALSFNYNVSWCCFEGALSKLNRINQVTKTPHGFVVLSAVAGSLHVMMKLNGIVHLNNMNIVYPTQIGNTDYSSPVLVVLPTGVEGAIPRLWFTKKAMENMYRSDQALQQAIVSLLMPLNASGARTLLSELTDNTASLQFSWVSGPRSRIVIKGSPLKTVYSILPPQKNTGVSISVFTYNNDVYVTVTADDSFGEKFGDTLLHNLKQQINQMYDLLRYRRVPKDKKSTASLLPNHLKDLSAINVKELMVKMKDIQMKLQTAKELGVFSDEAIGYANQLKYEYSTLLRELRKRKKTRQRKSVWQMCHFDGCCAGARLKSKFGFQKEETEPLPPLVKVPKTKNTLISQSTQDYRPRMHICRSNVYRKDSFLGLSKLPKEQLLTQI
ncbi:uncharacterized protein LOC126841720 isoform X2 [Adelges cooleyi]|uniref:uncharacterized protein LOC126841720 isoform X2 n=1 Tax=Adelges cooleyi TaxID=133065 RepID=UPI00217F589D|nr:uncharacterized protein LOC126841720 isoform X2 [Adelges cooleyi]